MNEKNWKENNSNFNLLWDNIQSLNDTMSNFRTNISSLNESTKFNTFQPFNFYTSEKTDKEKISDLERKVIFLEKNLTTKYIDLSKQANEINEWINSKVNDEIKNIEPKIDEKIKESVDKKVKEGVDEKMIWERNNIIWSLTLFVAFFTFISINITIFSKIDNLFTALVLMFWMLCSISMILIVFFSFLYKKFWQWMLIFIILITILSFTWYLLKDFFSKISLSPSYEDRIEQLENEKTNIEEKFKSLEDENKELKQTLGQQISKEIELQLLKQQTKNPSN